MVSSEPSQTQDRVQDADVSSARQRRRKIKQKQDLLGRKSRSSSDTSLESRRIKAEDHTRDSHQEKGDSDTEEVDYPGFGLDEMDDFVSLLHCTLHLSEAETQTMCSVAHPSTAPALPSGRLAERIRALRLYVCMYVSVCGCYFVYA